MQQQRLGCLILLVVFGLSAAYMWYAWVRPGVETGAHWSWYIIPALFVAWFLLKMFTPMSDENQRAFMIEALMREVEGRPPSFSVIVFHGDLREKVIEWISSTGFRVARGEDREGPFSEVIGGLLAAGRLVDRGSEWWAVFEKGAHTVLVDWPLQASGVNAQTMEHYLDNRVAVFTGNLRFADDALVRFCAENTTVATVATWDRITTLLLLRDVDRSGITSQTVLSSEYDEAATKERFEQIEREAGPPDPALVGDASYEGLVGALERRGIRMDEMMGDIQAKALLVTKPQATPESSGTDARPSQPT